MAGKRNASPFTRQRLQQVLGVSDFDRLFIMEHSGDGLDNTAFAHLWLAGDAAISGATGSAYTLADSDDGKPIKVRVNFTYDAGNEETPISPATAEVEAKPNNPATGARPHHQRCHGQHLNPGRRRRGQGRPR